MFRKLFLRQAKLFRFLRFLIVFVLFFVSLFFIFLALPIKNNVKLYAVSSGSMSPKIPQGSLVVVQPGDNYQNGNIITFWPRNTSSNNLMTHRIIGKVRDFSGRDFYKTRGDANQSSDSELVSKNQIVGRVVFSIPILGYLRNYLQNLVVLLLIIIFSTIIIYEECKKIFFAIKKSTPDTELSKKTARR